jgi:hypothetical protein
VIAARPRTEFAFPGFLWHDQCRRKQLGYALHVRGHLSKRLVNATASKEEAKSCMHKRSLQNRVSGA